MRAPSAQRPRRARGVSLIEVLIALLVIMVAMLGSLGLKAAGLKHAGQANARSVAALHAGEMFDRLRANPVRAAAGEYELALTDSAPATPSTIAEVDLAQWRARIAQNLPSGAGGVTVTSGGLARVELQWLERIDGEDAVTVSFQFEAQL